MELSHWDVGWLLQHGADQQRQGQCQSLGRDNKRKPKITGAQTPQTGWTQCLWTPGGHFKSPEDTKQYWSVDITPKDYTLEYLDGDLSIYSVGGKILHSTEDAKLGQLALGSFPRDNLSHHMLRKELISEIKSMSCPINHRKAAKLWHMKKTCQLINWNFMKEYVAERILALNEWLD